MHFSHFYQFIHRISEIMILFLLLKYFLILNYIFHAYSKSKMQIMLGIQIISQNAKSFPI